MPLWLFRTSYCILSTNINRMHKVKSFHFNRWDFLITCFICIHIRISHTQSTPLIWNTNSYRLSHKEPIAQRNELTGSWIRSKRQFQRKIHNSCAVKRGCALDTLRSRYIQEYEYLQVIKIKYSLFGLELEYFYG